MILKYLYFIFMTLIPSFSLACSVCYGANSNPDLSQGLNMAIIALIGVTGTVLGGIISFFVFIARRQKIINQNLEKEM